MAQSVQAAASNEQMIFKGESRAMNASIGMLVAGVLTFSMGMNRLFFVEAMAWTFIVWGALLLYGHIIDYSTTYEVTEEGLIVRSPTRFWNLVQKMEWGQVKRVNVVVSRIEATAEDATIQVIYTPEGTTKLIREDLPFNATLAQEIVSRAGLKPGRNSAMKSFDAIPQTEKGTYTWQ